MPNKDAPETVRPNLALEPPTRSANSVAIFPTIIIIIEGVSRRPNQPGAVQRGRYNIAITPVDAGVGLHVAEHPSTHPGPGPGHALERRRPLELGQVRVGLEVLNAF